MHKFIVTHKPINWRIPFDHRLVTVNGYSEPNAIDASDFIGKELNLNRAFAFFGGVGAILENISNLDDNDHIVVNSYRCFFSNNLSEDINVAVPENQTDGMKDKKSFRHFITPEDLQLNWRSDILIDFPIGCELVISRPLDLRISVIEQHSICHHVDDLLIGYALAIRSGLLNPIAAAKILTQPILIAAFASKVSFFRDLYERIWWIAKNIFKNHYIQRDGYQERSINFTLERIVSAYLMQKVYMEKTPTVCASLIHVDPNLTYEPGN